MQEDVDIERQARNDVGNDQRLPRNHLPHAALDSPSPPSIPRMNTHVALTRSLNDRIFVGVMGGIARRYGWNSTLLRFLFVVISIVSVGLPGILIYLILCLAIPEGSD